MPPLPPRLKRTRCLGPRAAWLFIVLGPAGCGDAAPPATPATATFRDSAGVTLVDNPADAAAPLPWSVGDTALLRIGVLDGPEAEQFAWVTDSHRLPDGSIAVTDGRTAEVRLFGADGTHRATWGGSGEGPGEFRTPGRIMSWAGDSLGIWDDRLRRLSVFHIDGSFGRSMGFASLEDLPLLAVEGRLEGGGLLGSANEFPDTEMGTRRIRPDLRAVILEPTGDMRANVGSVPGREAMLESTGSSVNVLGIAFGRRGVAAVLGDRVLLAPTDRWSLPIHASDGTLERRVRVDLPPAAITPEDQQAFIDQAIADAPEDIQPRLRGMYEEAPVPDSMSAFDAVQGGVDGEFWVRHYRPIHQEDRPQRWLVFDPEGRLLGSMDTPAGFAVHRIGADYLLGTTTDDLGVPRVELRPLRR